MKTTNLNLDITNENEKILDWMEKVNKGNDTIIDNYAAGLDTNTTSLSSRVNALESKGKFLSLWNSTTGLPITNPGSMPYNYNIGDYYIISVIGESNYMPSGESYSGIASTTPGRAEAAVGGTYYYEGEGSWNLQRSKITMPSTPSKAGTYKLACDVDRYGAVNYKWQTHINTLNSVASHYAYEGREINGVVSLRVYKEPEHVLVYENYGYTLTGTKTAKDVGLYPLYLTGIGDYYGTTTVYWGIQEKHISYTTATLGPSITYNSFQQTQTISEITDHNGYGDVWTLTNDEWEFDNTTSDKNYGVAAGTYTLRIAGKGNYKDYKRIGWTIAALDLSTTSGSAGESIYTGSSQYPIVSIQAPNAGVRYLPNTDYTYNGDRQTNAGVYNIQIDANSANCTGSLEMSWTIKKAPLTCKAGTFTINVEEEDPGIQTCTYTGFVSGESTSALTTIPTCKLIDADGNEVTYAQAAATAGVYRIVPSGGVANNYEFSYVEGSLTVNDAVEYFYLVCNQSCDMKFATSGTAWSSYTKPSFSYSTDKTNWSALQCDVVLSMTANTPYYFKGTNASLSYPSAYTIISFTTSGTVQAGGNIMTLLKENGRLSAVPSYGFAYLFNKATALTSMPPLPATTIGSYGYYSMFEASGVAGGTYELPATVVGDCGYGYMFNRCYSLTAVSIKATSFGKKACYQMFGNCESLNKFPFIRADAVNVGESAFGYMFYNCSKLEVYKDYASYGVTIPKDGGTPQYPKQDGMLLGTKGDYKSSSYVTLPTRIWLFDYPV